MVLTGEELVEVRVRQDARTLNGVQFVTSSGRISEMYGLNASAEQEWYARAGASVNFTGTLSQIR